MQKDGLVRVDLIEDSLSHLLTVCFAKSSSTVYPLALELAQGAAKYSETMVGKTLFHSAAFSKTRQGAALSLAIINYVSNWRSTSIFAGGKIIQNVFRAREVLACFIEATACHDWTAHCHTVINDPFSGQPDLPSVVKIHISMYPDHFQDSPKVSPDEVELSRYIFPCTYLHKYFTFAIDHPASPHNQIQAKAVELGVDWCPKFDPNLISIKKKKGGQES